MKIFEVLPEGFFSPLSSLNKDHYAACLLLYYDLFTDSQSGVERSRVVSAFEDYFHDNTELVDSEEEEGKDEDEREGLNTDPRTRAGIFLRRLISCGWLSDEVLEDFTQYINLCSWAKPYIEALAVTRRNEGVEYESHIIAVYSLLTGDAMKENGHYNVQSALNHTRDLIESLKILRQNIKRYLQEMYEGDLSVRDILHIHYTVYMHEVVDRAYNRLKTSDNLSKYRPVINHAVSICLQDEQWMALSSSLMASVRGVSEKEAKRQLVLMLKEIRDSLKAIDPILDDIDDKNRRYSRISTQKIKSQLYSDLSLRGKIRDCISSISETEQENLFHASFYTAGFCDQSSQYTRPAPVQNAAKSPVTEKQEFSDDFEAILKRLERQLNPKKVIEFLGAAWNTQKGEISAEELINDESDYIKLMYAAAYCERNGFPFDVIWKEGRVKVDDLSFQRHSYRESKE